MLHFLLSIFHCQLAETYESSFLGKYYLKSEVAAFRWVLFQHMVEI